MKCCNNNNQTNNSNHKGHFGHMLMMVLCCGAPIILLAVISLLGANFTGLKTVLAGIIPFICPIMMLIMIPLMFIKKKGNGKCHEDSSTEKQESGINQ